MAFAFTINESGLPNTAGDRKVVTGTFTNTDGDTGGSIVTGLSRVEFFNAQHTGTAVVASAPVANKAFPTADGTIPVVTVADANGVWIAYGR